MAVTNFLSRYGARIDVEAVSSPVMLQMTKGNLTADHNVVADPTSGDIYPRHIAINGVTHMASYTTNALQDALDEVGLTGQIVANAGVIFHGQHFTEGSTQTAGSNHRKYTITEGVQVGRRISCAHQEDAEYDIDVVATYDGTNVPITEADSAALPTAAVDNERFTIGACTIESIVIAQITNIVIEFGVEEVAVATDSDLYPTFVAVRKVKPRIIITTADPKNQIAAKVPRTGLPITHANTKIYLRKRSTTASGFVADGTAEHIKITANGIATVREIFTDNDSDPAGCTVEIDCNYDGTNAPLVFDTASAIT